jgi:hypothetical protein
VIRELLPPERIVVGLRGGYADALETLLSRGSGAARPDELHAALEHADRPHRWPPVIGRASAC